MAGANSNSVINITEAAQKRGIENPNQLWRKIGGSKSTSIELFNGVKEMIRTDTMNRIQDVTGIAPFE